MENREEMIAFKCLKICLCIILAVIPCGVYASDSGYAVGTPKGVLNVLSSGAATYRLDFEAPDGGPLSPQMGLAYNSQLCGYGLAGYGVNITGISAITRGGSDLFHDGRVAGVSYSASDNFFLDGKRLILLSGIAGQDGATYTVEGDPFTTAVVRGGNSLPSALWFEVKTNTGMTYQYGNTTGSRLSYENKNGDKRVAAWYVNRAADRNNNYITYEYATGNLCIRPTTITYGTNTAASRGITNKIAFAYQSLGDNARPFAIGDQQGAADACLSSVTTSCNNSVYRRYTFAYNTQSDMSQGKWTRLTTIEEENGDGEKLPPVSFQWHYLPYYYASASEIAVPTDNGSSLVSETSKQFLSADLNGDGMGDIIRIAPTKATKAVWNGGASYEYYTNVYISQSKVASSGDITYDTPLAYTLPSGISMDFIKSMYGGASVIDFDGDGYNDLVIPFQNTATGYWDQAVFYLISGSDVAAGKGGEPLAFAVNLKSTGKVPLFAAFDVDGNGKDEVVCVEQSKKNGYYPCTIVQHAGGTALNLTEINITLPQGAGKKIEFFFSGDYNNDGLPDLILLYNGGYKIYFNNGGTTAASVFTEGNAKSGTGFGDYWRLGQGDFDGDGLSDFVYNKSGETTLWIAHNNGDGTFSHTRAADIGVSNQATSKDDSRFAIIVFDMDHDGRSDVLVSKAVYKKNKYAGTCVLELCSTGSGLKCAGSYTRNTEDDANEGSIFLGDFDGDGNLELANYGRILNGADSTNGKKINIYKSWQDLSQAGKIACITDGMGNKSSIEYAYATSPAVYKKSIKSVYPVNTYTLPMPVVAKVTSDDGFARSQTTKYCYEDLRLHVAGRGLLGFNTVTSENTTLETKETSSITKWDDSLWIPAETKTVNTVGGDTSTTVSTYSISRSGDNYFAYVSQQEVTDFDGNTTTTVTSYDTGKGVVADETVKNDGDNMYKRVAYSGYENKSGTWVPATLSMTQKHADDHAPYTTVTTYSYDIHGNVLSTTVNSETGMALRTTATYDAYGNVLSSVTTGNGVKPITKYNDYDKSGRFVVKSYTWPASAVNTYTYDLWGNVLTESDATNPTMTLTTKHAYDGWGRRQTTQYADGTQAGFKTGWGTDNHKKYYTIETATGKPYVKTWYDKGGYEVSRESSGAKGMPLSTNICYNSKGQVYEVMAKTGTRTTTQFLTYDNRGRIAKEVSASGKATSYSYGNRSVTATVAGHGYTKTYDAWGNLIKSADPASEVSYKYSSTGKPACVATQGATIAMTYDEAGNTLSISDPDAGTSYYAYAADGTLVAQTDARGVKTLNTYDDLGRLSSSQIGQLAIAYTYGTSGNERLRLARVAYGDNSVEYAHDRFGRIVTETRNVGGAGAYSFSYSYNSNNQLSKATYPGGVEVSYLYDDNGFRSQMDLDGKTICKADSIDGYTSVTSFMGKLASAITYDTYGYESRRMIGKGSENLESLHLNYDYSTGNMLWRYKKHGNLEKFAYDNLDRLVSVSIGGKETIRTDYAPNGNILFKTGAGNFSYDESARPHAVAEVENAGGEITGDALATSFNELGKIEQIEDGGTNLAMSFAYGPDQQRWYSSLREEDAIRRTTVYAGNYEKITENGKTREFYYLDGNVIVVKEDGNIKPYIAFTDNLSSILSVIDEDGSKVFDASYDAWGKQTVAINTIGLHRGYTGHEMITEFGIINMNGRLYDPVLGRFFSPDPYVQMPGLSQSFNRYSYCLNNPLKYTDPSGCLFGIGDAAIAFAAFNVASGMMQAAYEGKSVWKAGAISLLSSAASYGIGAAFRNVGNAGHELLRAGGHGLASGVVASLSGSSFYSSFVSGAAASGIGSYAQGVSMPASLTVASATAMGGVAAWATGGSFLQGAIQGMNIGVFNHAMHAVNEGIRYYHDKGGNICGDLPEIVVKPSYTDLSIAAIANTVLHSFGSSLEKKGGNSTLGSNRSVYWHAANERGFYGNQYVRTIRLTQIGKGLSKATGPMGKVFDGYKIYRGYYIDRFQLGHNTARATVDVAGGWAGTAVGATLGAEAGAAIGILCGGAGVVPGTIIGGVIGGIMGDIGGSWLGTGTFDIIYGM